MQSAMITAFELAHEGITRMDIFPIHISYSSHHELHTVTLTVAIGAFLDKSTPVYQAPRVLIPCVTRNNGMVWDRLFDRQDRVF